MKIRIHVTNPDVISELITAIPEFENKSSANDITDRLDGKNHGIWCFYIGDEIAGFLVAYAKDEFTYYNWIMAVLPDFRDQGVGKYMIDHFENHASKSGYRKCAVKSMNRYRNMLVLLIRKDYDIILVEIEGKIYVEKKIDLSSIEGGQIP
jgi:ribosomal protein S18 acetylase RimI-like enzyme